MHGNPFKPVICFHLVLLLLLFSGCTHDPTNVNFYRAVRNKDFEEAKRLIDSGDVELNPLSKHGQNNKPLAIVAEHGNLELVSYILNKGADINGQSAYGDVALSKACETGNVDIIRFLIENGADVNIPNSFGMTPFIGICASGRLDLVNLAIEQGADVNQSFEAKLGEGAGKHNFSPIQYAVHQNRLEVVKRLLELGADPIKDDSEGRSCLEIAKAQKLDEMIALLNKAK